jgi:hypothetical protein
VMLDWIRPISRRRRARRVHPTTHEIVKFLPDMPPRRGDLVAVDGERCRVVRSRVQWNGNHWRLVGLWVKPL